jgi:hypothetical protein
VNQPVVRASDFAATWIIEFRAFAWAIIPIALDAIP